MFLRGFLNLNKCEFENLNFKWLGLDLDLSVACSFGVQKVVFFLIF